MNASDAYRDFVLRSQKIAISHGYDVINWYPLFDNFAGSNKLLAIKKLTDIVSCLQGRDI